MDDKGADAIQLPRQTDHYYHNNFVSGVATVRQLTATTTTMVTRQVCEATMCWRLVELLVELFYDEFDFDSLVDGLIEWVEKEVGRVGG